MKPMDIAILLTCHNRKEKTLSCLTHVYKALKQCSPLVADVYLTDDGSTDGTSKAVNLLFPSVRILNGSGNLYWAGGMRNSYLAASQKKSYDGYLLLNDDTNVSLNFFLVLLDAYSYCNDRFKQNGILVGSTADSNGKHTYGGSRLRNKYNFTGQTIIPNNSPQKCDFANANILFASKEAVLQIGFLHEGYIHGIADYDFTLTASKNKIPVLVLPGYCGLCEANDLNRYEKFRKLSIINRFKMLFDPIGLELTGYLLFMRRHYPHRYFPVLTMGLIKCVFPNLYLRFKGNL